MAVPALWHAVPLLLGAVQDSAAVSIDGGLGVQMGEGATSTAATAFSGGQAADRHASDGLTVTIIASDSAVHAESEPFSDGVSSRGRSLLHGCHGKRTAHRSIFLKCGSDESAALSQRMHAGMRTYMHGISACAGAASVGSFCVHLYIVICTIMYVSLYLFYW